MKKKNNIKLLYEANRHFLEGKRATPVNQQEMLYNIDRQVGIHKHIWAFFLVIIVCLTVLFAEIYLFIKLVEHITLFEREYNWYAIFFITLIPWSGGLFFCYITLRAGFTFLQSIIKYKIIRKPFDYFFECLIIEGRTESATVVNRLENTLVLNQDGTVYHYKTVKAASIPPGEEVYVQRLFIVCVIL